jgi:hypothetical protein
LYPKSKIVIFAKIAEFHEFPLQQHHKQEAELSQHQEQGRILIRMVASFSAIIFRLLLNFLNNGLTWPQAMQHRQFANRKSQIANLKSHDLTIL